MIDLSQNKDLESRIYQMLLEIFKIINETNPNTVVTEMTVVTRNAQTQRNLTMILGAIYGKCIIDNINYHSFRPAEWRKLISSEKKPRKRDELKLWSKEQCESLYGISDINDDISDAILLGQAYINKFISTK